MTSKIRGKNLTSKETARILGVSEASIKRWADGGLLPMIKTAGGHRRFLPEDVALFQRAGLSRKIGSGEMPQGANAVETKLLEANDAALIDEMFDALVDGGVEQVSSLLINLVLRGQSIAGIADYVLCPAMRKIGDYWQQGKLSVAEEHVASRAVMAALERLRSLSGAPLMPEKLAICCSAENDFHEFPIQIANLILENKGWKVVNLGASTPFYALNEAVERFRPRLVCVASTVLVDLDRAAREFNDFRRTARRLNVSIVLGGAGFSGKVGQRFESDLYAGRFEELESFAAALAN